MKNEELIDLMTAVMVYVETKEQIKNPFVKSFRAMEEEDEAYNLLVECLNRCEPYFPEIERLNAKRMEAIEMEEDELETL